MSTRVDLSTRYAVLIKAALHSGRGHLLNLSEGGAYVATHMVLLPQTEVQLRVTLPQENHSIDVEGVVTWENRGANRQLGQPPGYGLKFTQISEASRDALRELVRAALPERSRAPEPGAGESTLPLRTPAPLVPSAASTLATPEEADAGPYRLLPETLASRVPAEGPLVFVLYLNRTQEARVGRADRDPRGVLGEYIGEYDFFWFEPVSSIEEGYRRECKLFHHYGGDRGQLDGADHPFPPEGLRPAECLECGANAPGDPLSPHSQPEAPKL